MPEIQGTAEPASLPEFIAKATTVVPVVVAVCTLMTYVMGASIETARREALGLSLLSGPSKEDYLIMGRYGIALLAVLGVSVFLITRLAYWWTPRLPARAKRQPTVNMLIGLGLLIELVTVFLPNSFGLLSFVLLCLAAMVFCLGCFLMARPEPVGLGKPAGTVLFVVAIVMVFVSCILTADALGRYLAVNTYYFVGTFAPAVASERKNQEFLVLGSDDKMIAVLAAPNVYKPGSPGSILYIARSEIKTILTPRKTTVLQYSRDWSK